MIDRVLARLELPTLIFRYPGPGNHGGLPDPDSLTVRTVLLSVESNRAARAAEEVAYSLAAHNEGSVLALHLIAETRDAAFYLDPTSSSQNHRAGLELVEESVSFGERLGARVNAEVKPVSRPAGELVDAANTGSWDLLVMGATNRPLSRRPFFGYDMSHVIRHVAIPMVTVAIPDVVSRYGSADHRSEDI